MWLLFSSLELLTPAKCGVFSSMPLDISDAMQHLCITIDKTLWFNRLCRDYYSIFSLVFDAPVPSGYSKERLRDLGII